jgi:hypothetical protein
MFSTLGAIVLLPKIDEYACPFEGCQFGKWTASERVQIYSTWKADRKALGSVEKGETVQALTGIHITFEPEEIQVTAPMPQYRLKPDDMVFGLHEPRRKDSSMPGSMGIGLLGSRI